MFKRANKITALLVAAASVMSIVPAMASDVKKVDSQEGTVYNAVAYKDGSFYIDGEVEGKDEGAYYISDGKYTALEDVDSGDTTTTYGTKYLEVEDGDYYVDLTTGKVTDDSIKEDTRDDAATALRKKLNKDDPKDRYDATSYDTLRDDEKTGIQEIEGNKFAEDWYEFDYAAAAGQTANDSAKEFHVYTDGSGNYIDADYNLGKVNVVTTAGAVNLKNTNDDDEGVTGSIKHTRTIAQDKDNIYRLAELTISDGTTTFGSENKPVTVATTSSAVTVIQKISKAQDSEDIDDAKFAKTVSTYILANDKGGAVTTYSNYKVVDGKLINYGVAGGKLHAQAITLKSENGYYYTDLSDGTDIDTADFEAYTTDADGNLWILDGGYIKKFNNDDDFDKVYKVDGSFEEFNVYDKNNIVAWNEDDEVFSVIGGKSATDTTTDTTPVVTAGWAQAADGTWTYNKADGTKATGWFQDATGTWYYAKAEGTMVANGWAQYGSTWYYLGASGAMATGWVNDNGTWYYLAGSGAMATGWVNDNGTWYYLAASGAMLANTTVDGYVLGASGAWVK